jgi:acyl-CoA synthetase (AMP-forming)/AMP-acid ligase II
MMSAKRSKPPDPPAYSLAALQLSDRPAVAFRDARMTYDEIKAQVDRLATALARLGTGKGDRGGIMPPNCQQYLISLQSFIRFHSKEE